MGCLEIRLEADKKLERPEAGLYRLMLSETCVAIPQWPFLFQGRVSQGGCPNDCSIYLYNNYGWRVSASERFSRVRRLQLGPSACEDGEAFIFFTQEASLWERGNRDRDRRPLQALAQDRQGDEREYIKISHGRMGVGHDSFLLGLGLVGYMIYGRGGRL